jgi:oxepin-CoA hydrolase/3-oxo-5,6-dehydrosuberyl-CoA semialdehyde dehydrogenase
VRAALDETALPELERRLRALAPDAPARWGRMDAHAMLRHVRATLAMSLGELEVPLLVPTWIGAPVGLLFTDVLTRWPRGLGGRNPPLPALHPPADATLDVDRERLVAALRRFVDARRSEPRRRALHPVFGQLALERWARVHALHLAHHLRQFGA